MRRKAGLPDSYRTWRDISRGLMTEAPGPSIEEELRWDTATAFTINSETPWDILRAQLLWAVWCQRVEIAFREDYFHLGVVLWHAWKNTIYCAMEAYKELFRHKRNEEKRHELISCFQLVWTTDSIFGRMREGDIRWHLTPPKEFLPEDLAAWTATPIRIHRTSPSPDVEADFVAHSDFSQRVSDFLQDIADNLPPQPQEEEPSISTAPQSSTSHQPHAQSGEGSRRPAPGEEPSEGLVNSDREGSPPINAAELLHTRQMEEKAEPRSEIRPSTSNVQTGASPYPSLKRKSPLAEEQEHHNERPERGKIVSRRKRKCRRAHRTSSPHSSFQNPPSPISLPHSLPLEPPLGREGEQQPAQEGQPRSRRKTKCRFGPRKQGSDFSHAFRESHPLPLAFVSLRMRCKPSLPSKSTSNLLLRRRILYGRTPAPQLHHPLFSSSFLSPIGSLSRRHTVATALLWIDTRPRRPTRRNLIPTALSKQSLGFRRTNLNTKLLATSTNS